MGKIAWKVVHKRKGKRLSAIVSEGCKYCLEYPKGKIVKAPEGTLGVFCFREKEDAQKFLASEFYSASPWIIIKVKGIGKEVVPKVISTFITDECLDDFYNKNDDFTELKLAGTVCYPAVKVLT